MTDGGIDLKLAGDFAARQWYRHEPPTKAWTRRGRPLAAIESWAREVVR